MSPIKVYQGLILLKGICMASKNAAEKSFDKDNFALIHTHVEWLMEELEEFLCECDDELDEEDNEECKVPCICCIKDGY